MADRRTFKQTEDGEVEIVFEELHEGDVFRLENPDGERIEGLWRAVEEPKPVTNESGVNTWGVRVEPA
jgi:hypothetical protein